MSSVEAWVATYPGGEKFLDDTVASLKEQGFEPVVVNDTRPVWQKWNEAIDKCMSNYLALPHHDDIYLPGWSKELSAYLDSHPEAVAVFCLDYLVNEQGKRIGQTYPAWDEKDSYTFKDLFDITMQHGNALRCETVMFNRKLLGEMRFPDNSACGTANDTQFWFELAAKHPIGIVMKPLVKYRVHPASDTQKNVVPGGGGIDHIRAMLYASTLRPQDVEFTHIIGLTRALERYTEVAEANRVRTKQGNGCEFLVCHEPPDAAGTGVVVAHRVRTLNREEGGPIRYYVYPTQGKEIEIVWEGGLPAIRCPAEAFGQIVESQKPGKIEYHHLLRWPLDVLNAPCERKELWLNDSFLWCARYHSVNKEGEVCNEPEPKKCSGCSGEPKDFLERKKMYLGEVLPKLNRYVANSEYTAEYAKEHLGIDCEVVHPTGEALAPSAPKKRVGYFGGFYPVKGTPVLLKAWRVLQKNIKKYVVSTYSRVGVTFGENLTSEINRCTPQLLMFCDVPAEWKNGRKLAGFDDVLVMGGYHRNDLPDLCNLVDLAVIPSINESYGLVKRELEGLGLPVIASKTGGLDGTIVPSDAEQLAEAIRAAL